VNTEMTDNNAKQPAAGWVCYDGECAFCLGWVRVTEKVLRQRGFGFIPLQTPWVRARLNATEVELMAQGRLMLPDGRILGGAETAVFLVALAVVVCQQRPRRDADHPCGLSRHRQKSLLHRRQLFYSTAHTQD
jgi:hypothetical protein